MVKSGSESSLSDVGETTSAKESARRDEEKDVCSDNEEQQQYPEQVAEAYDEKRESYSENDEDDKDLDMCSTKKLEKQGAVVLRRKSKCNPLYRKSKFTLFY